MTDERTGSFTRRDFCKTAAAAPSPRPSRGPRRLRQGSDAFRVGVIGCGGRGHRRRGRLPDCRPGGRNRRARRPRPRPRRDSLKTLKEKFPDRVNVPAEPALHRLRQLPRRLLLPGGQPHRHRRAAGLPPDSPEGGDRSRQARLHGEARGRRSGRRPLRHRLLGAGREERPGHRRRHAAPPPEALSRADEAHPGRADRRDRRRPSATGTRATCGSSSANPT